MKNIVNTMRNTASKVKTAIVATALQVRCKLAETRGEGYIDTAVKILIAVVLGALLLAGLYALFGNVVMPTLEDRITEMFDYAG